MQAEIVKFNKILVANRGEIAIRILRAIAELNISTVANYTYEDRYSLQRYKADEAYMVGEEDEPLSPYLDIEAVISVAKRKNVDAIHPATDSFQRMLILYEDVKKKVLSLLSKIGSDGPTRR